VQDVAEARPAEHSLFLGPAAAQAMPEGRPGPAAIGFARKQGVPVESLEIVEGPKGRVIAARVQSGGERSAELVAAGLGQAILDLPFPRSMRWGSGKARWGRPLHGIIALHGGAPIAIAAAGLQSGASTVGHRLSPEPFAVTGSADWAEQLRAHHVEPDPAARRSSIEAQLRSAAEALGAEIRDWDLLDEVTNIVEWPVVIPAAFSAHLLDLPPRLLVESMKVNQRVFPLYRGEQLLSDLLVVTNHPHAREPEALATIATGNARVLAARFYDARFFYAEDRKQRLEQHNERLGGRQWIRDGGTMADKAARVAELAAGLAPLFGAAPEHARQAGALCKADLATQMVNEFPELQGHVGRLLAGFDGLPPEVGLAIEEHYLPRGAGDQLPQSPAGRAVAVADRLDSLAGCFGLGLKPKGSADPLGLRRAANGLLTVVLESGLRVDLRELLAMAAAPAALDEVHDFVLGRLKAQLGEQVAPDFVEAVISTGDRDPVALRQRVCALAALAGTEDFAAIRRTFKRVFNIAGQHGSSTWTALLQSEPAEQALGAAFLSLRDRAQALSRQGDWEGVLALLSELRPAVDRLFDEVLVMDPQPALRDNRLGLLKHIAEEFGQVADFSRLSSEG
jgi:glycyl-tRNA synthetase beta chain